MRPHLRRLTSAMALAAIFAAAPAARAQTGPFVPGRPVFLGPGGLPGVQRVGTTQINVDTNRDGIPDTIFTLPPAIQSPTPPDADLVIEDRLSPSQGVLYTMAFHRNGDPMPGCSNGGASTVSFYRLGAPPGMTPIAVGVCLPAGVAIGPVFYDPLVPSTFRTAVLATDQTQGANQALLWVDLEHGDHNLDTSTYLAAVEPSAFALQFAPAGNAAFVRHATGTPSPQYSLIDLCRSRVAGAGSATTQALPAGTVTAHVVAAAASLRAELHVGGVPLTGSGIDLDNCFGSSVFLELTKSAPPSGIVQSGQQFDYVLSIVNTGSAPATDVVLEDIVPGGTAFVSATGGRQPDANGVVRWDFATLPPGLQNGVQVILTVRPDCPQFQIISNDRYALRSTETGTLQGGPVETLCIPPPPVRLSITKTGPAAVRQGELLTYTLEYANSGTQTAGGAVIEDTLPAGSVFVSATGNGSLVGGLVRWTVNVPAGGHGSVTLTVRAGCLPQIVNGDYSIRGGGLGAVRGPQVVTTVTAASTSPVEVTVTSTPITRPPPLQRGDIVQYVITLRNTVAERRNGLSIHVSAGRAARFDQILDAGGGQAALTSPQTLVWLGSLEPNGTATIVVTTRIEECLRPTDTSTQLNDGRPIEVVDTCNRILGSQPAPAPLGVLPPVVARLTALNLGAPQSGLPAIDGLVQAARAGSEIDLQVALTNQSPNAEGAVAFRLVLPGELTPVGAPPFVPPSHASAVYDDATRTIAWNGAIDAGATVLVTFRVRVAASPACATRIAVSGSVGVCQTLATNLTILAVPEVPAEKHLIGSDHRLGLWMFRPGIDTDLKNLLCLPGEIYTGIDRAANGDVWVAGLPSYRFNPATLELQVVDMSKIRPPDFHLPVDVAIDATAAVPRPIFLLPGPHLLSRLVQFDPAAGQATVLRDGLPPMTRIVVDRQRRIAGIVSPDPVAGTPGGVLLVDPLNPANDRLLSGPAYPSLDLDLLDAATDGTFVVGAPVDPLTFAGTQNLLRVDPGAAGPGTFSLMASDLAALIPPPQLGKRAFHAIALGASADVYLGRIEAGSLGVLHGSTPPTGNTLAIGRNVVDLEFVDPAAPPSPPPPGPVAIEVSETVLVADAVALLPGIIVRVDEQVIVQDTVNLLPGLLLRIDEQIVVSDEANISVPDNTPAGSNVVVSLRDPITGRIVLVRFPLVTRSGMTMFTSRAEGPSPPPGFLPGEPSIAYDVTSTALFSGPATVCLSETQQRFVTEPRIFHFEGASWIDRTASIDPAAGLVCAGVATFSPFALFQAADRTPPVTTVVASPGPNLAGWNRTNVALAVSAADGSGGSGVKRVQVSLTGAQTATLIDPVAPIVISAEGTTTATYFAEDNTGNVESPRTLVVRIDRTPPEFETRFDPRTAEIAVFGVDGLSGVPAGPVHPAVVPWPSARHSAPGWDLSGMKGEALQRRRYEVVDAAGNRTAMWIHVLPHHERDRDSDAHRLIASITSLQYGDDAPQVPWLNELSFTSTFDKGRGLKQLTQTMAVAAATTRRIVEASYQARRGITIIEEGKHRSIERAGLALLQIDTSRGSLSIQY